MNRSEENRPFSQFVRFRYALPDILVSTLCLLAARDAGESDPWLANTRATLSHDLRCDLEYLFAPLGGILLLDRLATESPVLDDVAAFIGWIASWEADDLQRSLEGALRCIRETGRYSADAGIRELIAERAAQRGDAKSLSSAQIDRIERILGDPHELKATLIYIIARFWESHFKAVYGEWARRVEQSIEYQHQRAYSGELTEYYQSVTGHELPKGEVERHGELETLVFIPSVIGGSKTLYVPLKPHRRSIAIIYNCLLARENEASAQLSLRSTLSALKAMGDATRLEILSLLDARELYAQQIVERMAIGQSTVSRHLRVLVEADLIRERRENGMKFYRIHAERFSSLARRIATFRSVIGDEEALRGEGR